MDVSVYAGLSGVAIYALAASPCGDGRRAVVLHYLAAVLDDGSLRQRARDLCRVQLTTRTGSRTC